MKTVAVVEGWAGGPKLSHEFTQALALRNFEITKKIAEADIIFAHSTACYLLPSGSKDKKIFLLDPPYWPGRSIIGRWIDLLKTHTSSLSSGFELGDFLIKKFWEIYYIFAKPRFSWSILRNQSDLEFLNQLDQSNLTLIRNKHDQFCSPEIRQAIKNYKNVRYIELPGSHEDYYTNPAPYVELLIEEV